MGAVGEAVKDYYDTLGVARDADAGALKAAYRKLAMKFHPDRNPGDTAAETRFKEINEAYEVLKDDQKRAAYDRFGHEAFTNGGGAPGHGGFSGFSAGGFADMKLQKSAPILNDKLNRAAKKSRDKQAYLYSSLNAREAARQFYRKLPPTEEWAENNYYRLPIDRQKADLIKVNPFWNDFASHPADKPFLSGNFIYATGNFAEMMLALAVLDLPFEADEHQVENEGVAFSLRSGKPLLLFHQEIF